MSTELTLHQGTKADAIETALISGDLSKLSTEERLNYYNRTCESLGLNPLTQPLAYINLNGKLTLYAKRDATEQLRKINGVSITKLEKLFQGDLYIVTAEARDKIGRTDASTGAVSIANLKGENLANALMKAETKAKRRVTLSICGLGMLDESEASSIPGAHPEGESIVANALVEIIGIVRQEKEAEKYFWYELETLNSSGEVETVMVKSPKETDTGGLKDKIGWTVELKAEIAGKQKGLGVYLLVVVGRVKAPPEPAEAPQTRFEQEMEAEPAEPHNAAPAPSPRATGHSAVSGKPISIAQAKRLWAIAHEKGVSKEVVMEMCGQHGFESVTELTYKPYNDIVTMLQQYVGGE